MNEPSFKQEDDINNDNTNNNSCYSPPKKLKMENDHQDNEELPSSQEVKGAGNKGAIYITVGPQCSGKTTILKQLFGSSSEEVESDSMLQQDAAILPQQPSSGLDVTIDDQPLVYLSLPTPIYLNPNPCIYDSKPGIKVQCSILRNEVLYGRSILDRICDKSMDEVQWVLQRLTGLIDAEFFATRIRDNDDDGDKKQAAQSTNTKKVRTPHDDLIDAVEYIIQTKTVEGITNLLPETVDLFIVESIFRPRPLSLFGKFAKDHPLTDNIMNNNATEETSSALEAAQSTIQSMATDPKQYPSTSPISWGNTNTRPREMVTALQAAERSQRPVHFIIYGGLEACDKIRNHTFQLDDDLTLCLPKLSRLTLLQRNIGRFIETGRYIPCMAVADALERVNSMIGAAVAEANKEEQQFLSSSERAGDAKFRLDFELARAAGYRLHADRTVSSLSSSSNNRGNSSARGRGNNIAGSGGRGRYNGGRNDSYRGGRGHNHNDDQGHQRGRGRRGGGRSYLQGGPTGRGGRGGGSYSPGRGRGGSSYNSQGRGRGRHNPNQGYGGRSYNQYHDDSSGSRGNNSTQYHQRSRGSEQSGRGRGGRY